MSEANSSEVQRAHFNRIADRYLTSRSHPNHLAYKEVMWGNVMDRLAPYLAGRRDAVGLDAMCGNAEVAERLLDAFEGLTVDGFDYSDDMVASARERTGERVRVFQQDITTFDAPEAYDVIVLVGGLHHVPGAVETAVANLYRALKPGGLFLNFEPTHNNPLWGWVRDRIYQRNDLFEESTEQGFALKDYNAILRGAGFTLAEQFYPGLLGYVLYYNPDAFPLLNRGRPAWARAAARLDLALGRTWVGRLLSFNTWTFARKP